MAERKKLADILTNSDRARLEADWETTAAAGDFGPIPAGTYRCRVTNGALSTARNGKPSYKLTLEVTEGDHAGRKLWHDLWLTDRALPLAKRDLAKLGVTNPAQLERPLPPGLIINAKVTLQARDGGAEWNSIKHFAFVGIEPPDADPFAPADDLEDPDAEPDPADDDTPGEGVPF